MSADLWQRVADEWDRLTGDTVFADLGYEPNCLPRHEARKNNLPLPEPCGQCPQELFHTATEFDVLFGGSLGGGKTKSLLLEALRACVRHPGLRVGAFRRTYGELNESLITELAAVGYAQAVGASWNGTERDLRFSNGSLLMFRYAENMVDATRRQGGQYQLLLFDERTLTPPDVVTFLSTRLRSGRADIPVLGIRSGTNPGGVGHGAVKTRYIDATEHGQKVVTDDRGRTVRFIQSRASDNPHLNKEYVDDLNALPERMRKAFRDGDWTIFEGQCFAEWRHERHVVAPFTLDPSYTRGCGVDYGYRHPYVAMWGARDEDGRIWIFREQSGVGVAESEQARRILAAETDERNIGHYGDPSMWARKGDAPSPAEAYRRAGLALTPATNDRIPGWQRMHTYLDEAAPCAIHREMGWETCPLLHVFSTCTDLIRTLPYAPYKKGTEDVEKHEGDDFLDAARYLLMGIGRGGRMISPPEQPPAALDGSPLVREIQGIGYPTTPTVDVLKRKSRYAP